MKTTLSLVLFGLIAVLLLSGCPRDTGETGGDSSENPEGRKPDYTQQDETPAADASAVADGEEAADATAAEDGEAVEGEDGKAAEDGEAVEGEVAEGAEGEEAVADEDAAAEGDTEEPAAAEEAEAGEFPIVVFETSIGDIEMEIRPDWAPIGAAHFMELVKAGFYDGAPFFRVIEGFMAQTGFSGDDELNKQYLGKGIQDEPVVKGTERGTVAFGKSGMPNSRSTHIFINFKDNSPMLSPQGFCSFAHVITGMDIVDKIFVTGENPRDLQGRLSQTGAVATFVKNNPDVTVIKRAYVKE